MTSSRSLRLSVVLAIAVFAAAWSCTFEAYAQQNADEVTLTILHYNDFHSANTPYKVAKKDESGNKVNVEVGGYAFLAAYINQVRKSTPNTFLLHAGDDFQGSPVSTITRGRSQFEILNLIQPDVMTPGNHEFDYGRDTLRKFLSSVTFPVVSANLFDTAAAAPFIPPWRIVKCGGLAIGVIGLSPMELPTLTLRDNIRGLVVRDPAVTTRGCIADLKRDFRVDMIVVLSHMGVENDSALAANVDGIDVIVGGHSHTTLFKPLKVRGTWIVQAGSRGRFLGRLDVTYSRTSHAIVKGYGKLIEVRDGEVQPDSTVLGKVNEMEKLVSAGLAEVIGTLQSDWVRGHGPVESNVGNWMADAARDYMKADVGFVNSGGIRKDIIAGPITLRDIWEISPFSNELVSFTVTGRQLESMIKYQGEKDREFCQVSGLSYSYDRKMKKLTMTVGGAPVDPAKTYKVATSNFVASHLDEVFGLSDSDVKVESPTPAVIDREVYIDLIRRQKTINSRLEGRIRITGE